MLKYRLIFGPILVALLLGICWVDYKLELMGFPKGVALLALAAVAVIMAAREFAVFLKAKNIPVETQAIVVAAWTGLKAVVLAAWVMPANAKIGVLFLVLIPMLLLVSMFHHARKTRSPEGALLVGGAELLSCIYLGVLTSFLLLIRIDFGILCTIGIIMIVKSCDIGAYFTGRLIGKTKLIPWISPGKTREGLAGGVVFSSLVAVGFQQLYLPASILGGGQLLPLCCPWTAALFGAVFAVLGQGGDLLASMFKRDAGVKDSGNSLPGFGGVLDVLDSPIAIAPLAYGVMKILTCSTCS